MTNNKNQRLRERKRKRHNYLVDKRHDEEIYKEAKLDPETIEGQSKLPIHRLIHTENVSLNNDQTNDNYFSFIKRILNF